MLMPLEEAALDYSWVSFLCINQPCTNIRLCGTIGDAHINANKLAFSKSPIYSSVLIESILYSMRMFCMGI